MIKYKELKELVHKIAYHSEMCGYYKAQVKTYKQGLKDANEEDTEIFTRLIEVTKEQLKYQEDKLCECIEETKKLEFPKGVKHE